MIKELIKRGVKIHAPETVSIEGVDPLRFEADSEIFPSCVIRGAKTCLGARSRLGMGGGGYFENVGVGRDAQLMSGVFRDCVCLDGVVVRSSAELREGTLLEEASEAGHCVGLKQTIFFPECIAGSLINFCDALLCGGTSRRNHSEIGSAMALYNFTPWGDKFASIFGDVAGGICLDKAPIFIGGQTQIVSPVHVDFGSVIAAGSKLQQDVSADRLILNAPQSIDMAFDKDRISRPLEKLEKTIFYIANLCALLQWYTEVRVAFAGTDAFLLDLYALGEAQVRSALAERKKRMVQFLEKMDKSLQRHEAARHESEIRKHRIVIERKDEILKRLEREAPHLDWSEIRSYVQGRSGESYISCVRSMPEDLKILCTSHLQSIVSFYHFNIEEL